MSRPSPAEERASKRQRLELTEQQWRTPPPDLSALFQRYGFMDFFTGREAVSIAHLNQATRSLVRPAGIRAPGMPAYIRPGAEAAYQLHLQAERGKALVKEVEKVKEAHLLAGYSSCVKLARRIYNFPYCAGMWGLVDGARLIRTLDTGTYLPEDEAWAGEWLGRTHWLETSSSLRLFTADSTHYRRVRAFVAHSIRHVELVQAFLPPAPYYSGAWNKYLHFAMTHRVPWEDRLLAGTMLHQLDRGAVIFFDASIYTHLLEEGIDLFDAFHWPEVRTCMKVAGPAGLVDPGFKVWLTYTLRALIKRLQS